MKQMHTQRLLACEIAKYMYIHTEVCILIDTVLSHAVMTYIHLVTPYVPLFTFKSTSRKSIFLPTDGIILHCYNSSIKVEVMDGECGKLLAGEILGVGGNVGFFAPAGMWKKKMEGGGGFDVIVFPSLGRCHVSKPTKLENIHLCNILCGIERSRILYGIKRTGSYSCETLVINKKGIV